MTLQQLEYIVAVDKYRHFVKAAESCEITQSTLSSLIQKLENELDAIIFDRTSHPIKPTVIGESIIAQAKIILYNAEQLKEFVQSQRKEESGSLRIGTVSTIAPYILPKLFKKLSTEHSQIQVSVEEARILTITEKLERAELDVAILPMPIDNKELLEIPIYKERFMAYVSPSESFFDKEQVCVSKMPTENLWVLREAYCPNSGKFTFCCKEKGNAAIYEAGSIETLVKIVDENGGFSIIPELHVALLSPEQQKRIKPMCNPEPSREVALVVRKDFVKERLLNILAKTVIDVIPEHMVNERVKKYSIKL
ncbi:MAG: LysR family transcriptional regulator [Muribaculaceae bacterium]|nr:LysR family transcriptional regulator [Muribaculaceae bacterium]